MTSPRVGQAAPFTYVAPSHAPQRVVREPARPPRHAVVGARLERGLGPARRRSCPSQGHEKQSGGLLAASTFRSSSQKQEGPCRSFNPATQLSGADVG